MKLATTIVRLLLGLIFLVFGLNGFFHFIPGALPTGPAGTFLRVLITSHYLFLVAGVQLIAAILLLINQFVPLALTLLGAMIANILVYHLTMDLPGIPLALIVFILWGILMMGYRAYFGLLFARNAQVSGTTVPVAPTNRARV